VSLAQQQGDDVGVGERVTEEEVFTTLSNRRRRYAIHALDDVESETDLGSLAERVAAWEYDVAVGELSHDERKRVYTSLQQTHLPHMDDAGLVEFDKDRGTVRPTETLTDLDIYLEVVRGNELPWSKYYLGLSGLAGTILLAVWTGVPPFGLVPPLGWVAFIVSMFAVSAVVHHYYREHRRLGAGEKPPEARRGEGP
jgi:DNA-binding transcriptional ArsR family regulator